MRECWNGRQARLRCVWLCRGGSSPLSRTKKRDTLQGVSFFGKSWDSNPSQCRRPVGICRAAARRRPPHSAIESPLFFTLKRKDRPHLNADTRQAALSICAPFGPRIGHEKAVQLLSPHNLSKSPVFAIRKPGLFASYGNIVKPGPNSFHAAPAHAVPAFFFPIPVLPSPALPLLPYLDSEEDMPHRIVLS